VSDGHVIKSYGGPTGLGTPQIHSPAHLAVDRNGFVYAADAMNDGMAMLSPALSHVREVMSPEQLDWRRLRLWIDSDTRRLYVTLNRVKDGIYTAGKVAVVSV